MAYQYRQQGVLKVTPMFSNEDVAHALRAYPRMSSEYVAAVFRSYVELKFARGKTATDIHHKLIVLEREFPQYENEFTATRTRYRLPKSPFFGVHQTDPLRRYQSVSSVATSRPQNSMHRTSTSTSRIVSTPTRTNTITTTRPSNPIGDDTEPPPPPYTRVDPEPESTRMLEERLAAESVNTNTVYEPPRTSPPISSPSPANPNRQSNRQSQSQEQRPLTPPRIPSDPELRQLWEESQLEEAKRMSRAAERERIELEEAMRLSLADAERASMDISRSDQQAGSSRGYQSFSGQDSSGDAANGFNPGEQAGRSSASWQNPSGQHEQNRASTSSITNDMAALNIPGGWDPQTSRPSSSQAPHPTSLLDDDDNGGASHLDAPMLTPMKTGAVMQSKNPFLSHAEHEELDQSLLPTRSHGSVQSPTPTHQAHIPQEQPRQDSDAVYGYPSLAYPQTPQQPTSTTHLSPPSSGRGYYPSDEPLRDSPGSSYTTYTAGIDHSPRSGKPLPPPPGPGGIQPGQQITEEQRRRSSQNYAPPPGPPPAHLRIPTPPGVEQPGSAQQPLQNSRPISNLPPLPPRRDTALSPQKGGSEQPSSIQRPLASLQRPSQQPIVSDGQDPLEGLKEYDTVFLIDDSAAMAGARWEQAKDTIVGVAEIAAGYDDDGVDVYFLNSKRVGKELKTRDDVEDLFAGLRPRGDTPTGARLEVLLRDYMNRLERASRSSPGNEPDRVKPMNLIVVTHGISTDDPTNVIVNYASRLDKGGYPLSQVGIQFFQIGNDPNARESLQVLDDFLSEAHGVRDMVDTVPYNGEEMSADLIVKTLLGGINRRQDER